MRKHKRNRENPGLGLAGWIVSLVQAVLSVLVIVLIWRLGMLPTLVLAGVVVVLAVLWVVCRLLMGKAHRKPRFYVGFVLAILISAALCVSGLFLNRIGDTLRGMTGAEYETTEIGVYVLADDPAQTITDAADYTFGILGVQAREETDQVVKEINENLGSAIATVEYDDAAALAQGLLDGQCQAILINEGFLGVITETEGYESFADQIRELDSYSLQSAIEQTETESDSLPEGVFTMYISGIDVAGDISTRSRSDVNILAVVNTNTHQVQLINTPRDYYVPLSISNGVKDKLTHAGIYGVDVSKDTLGMLYGIDINYYFRINFSGFQELIDALGGITVNSDVEFDAGGYHFDQGANTVNGEQALAFARERKSFASGDRQRGQNQMAVITGVIQKMQSPAILQNFSQLMDGIEGSFESDMPYELMSELVRDQLSGGGSWNVASTSVDGTGSTASTYSMNQPLYVMIPDEATVDHAKTLIQTVVDGGAASN